MSGLSTHILDTSTGHPAAGVPVTLERRRGDRLEPVNHRVTDTDGRIRDLVLPGTLEKGEYQLTFDTSAYAKASGQKTFYPFVVIIFAVTKPDQHHHVPLLLSPFGYSTYRGS